MTTDTDADREAFEAAMFEQTGLHLGIYVDAYQKGAWEGWKAAHARQPGEPVAWQEAPLSCDVHLPPNTYIRKGCQVKTLIAALARRGSNPDAETTFPRIDTGENIHAHPAPPAPVAVPEGFAAGIKAAAAWVQARLDGYVEKHGNYDYSTGQMEFPGTGEEYVGELDEIIEGISALSPSPASPEKGTERLREALEKIAKNEQIVFDEDLGCDVEVSMDAEEMADIARAALASLPAEPEGEAWFAADVRRAAERQEQVDAASPSRRAAALSALAEMDADEICATHPTAPKPAEVIAEDAFLQMRERVSTVREEHRRKMNAASDRAEMAAAIGDMKEVSINSSESERHREAFVALNVAIGIIDQTEYSALSPAPAAEEFRPTHRHIKRGSEYRVIGEAEAQVSTGDYRPDWTVERRIADGDRLTVYQGADGKLWVRFTDEFNDGRFIRLTSGEG
ncbi:hypothetical protein V5F79_22425 [Xanthobacter flavus]|uniref:hypothetical protein n=1 Tax=Xanthobacter flavus TaxID=281 RepID=UPI0037289341